MMGRGLSKIALIAAFVLVIAACGDDEPAQTTSPPPAPTTAAAPQTTTTSPPVAAPQTTTTSPPVAAPETTTTSPPVTTAATQPPTTEAPQGLAPGVYKFGYEGPLTGPVAFAGIGVLDGIKAAFDEVNMSESLGAGVRLELVDEDDANDQAKGISATELFLNDESFVGLFCCVSSSVTGTIKPLIDDAGMPSVITTAIMSGATEGSVMFRPKPDQVAMNTQLVNAAFGAFGIKTAIVVVNADNEGTAAIGDRMGKDLEALGVQVFPRIEVFQEDTDMSGPATKIIDLNPDVVFHSENSQNMVLVIRELHDRGYEGDNIGTNAIADSAIFATCGPACAGVPYVETYFPDPSNPDPFMKDWLPYAQRETGEDLPSTWFSSGYTAALLMIEGIKNAAQNAGGQPLTREALVAGLAAVGAFDTPLGTLSINSDGQGEIDEILLLQLDVDGKVLVWDGTSGGLARQ